jgi:hypothetical protein
MSKNAVFAPLREGWALQRNRRTSIFLMALGKHPVGVPAIPSHGATGQGQTLWPQVPVAALIRLSPEWAKSGESRSTMPDRDHSSGLGRRHVRTQAIHQRPHGGGVAPLQSY